jgi:hypothetical protein
MSQKEKKFHFIYKTTDTRNGNFYIGMHSTNNLDDDYIGSGTRLKHLIYKHGKKIFNMEILEFLPNRKSLKEREIEIVNSDLLLEEKCMNLKLGGGGGFNNEVHAKKFHSAGGRKVRQMFNKINTERLKNDDEYKNRWYNNVKKSGVWSGKIWKGRKHSEETKRKIGDSNSIKQKGNNNSQFGTCWITNGNENKKIKKEEPIQNGWRLGRQLKGL